MHTQHDVIDTGSGADLMAYEYWDHMADPLHFGDFGRLTTKLIWFVFSLALSGLYLSGACLHVQRLRTRSGARHRWPVVGAQRLADVASGVAVFIGGWLALTLAIIAVWLWLLWPPAPTRGLSRNNPQGSKMISLSSSSCGY